MPLRTKKYKKVATKKTIIIQGFNIQSDDNILKGASVVNNIAESNIAQEEIIIQGFNLTENSNNNDLEGALVSDNKVVVYEKDEEQGEEVVCINVSNINYSGSFTSRGSMINGSVTTGDNSDFETINAIHNNNLQVENIEFDNNQTSRTLAIGLGEIVDSSFNTNQAEQLQESNWTIISVAFTDQNLVEKWIKQGFSYEITQGWTNVFSNQINPNDYLEIDFFVWLRDNKLTPEQLKGGAELSELKEIYQEQQLQAQVEIPPKN